MIFKGLQGALKMINEKFFTTGYIYIYSIGLVVVDTFTLSRVSSGMFDLEVFSGRVFVVFTYWIAVKNLAGIAERRGHSYKVAMIIGILGLPTLVAAFAFFLPTLA